VNRQARLGALSGWPPAVVSCNVGSHGVVAGLYRLGFNCANQVLHGALNWRKRTGAGLLGLDLPRTAETQSTVAGISLRIGMDWKSPKLDFPCVPR
jgi:hypothetical protein